MNDFDRAGSRHGRFGVAPAGPRRHSRASDQPLARAQQSYKLIASRSQHVVQLRLGISAASIRGPSCLVISENEALDNLLGILIAYRPDEGPRP